MKKILIDATSISDQFKSRGIGIYSKEVITRLAKYKDVEWHLICFNDPSVTNIFKDLAQIHSIGEIQPSGIKNLFLFKNKYKPIIDELNPDLYFCPQFDRGLPANVNTAVMIHDIIPIITNSYSKKGFLQNWGKGMFYKHQFNKAKKADLILTNSNFSKQELVNKAGIDESKIAVTYLGVNDVFRNSNAESIKEKYSLADKYLLYYGGFERNKNVPSLIKAYEVFAAKHPEIPLVIVTGDALMDGSEFHAANASGIDIVELLNQSKYKENFKILPSLNQNELAPVMKGALAFVHLSTYEGFGLSVAEAVVSSTPAVISSASCYKELFDGEALFVDPYDVNQIANSVEKICFEESVRSSIIAGEKKIASQFSWDLCAEKTHELLIKIMYGK